jgi:hypothetical protein
MMKFEELLEQYRQQRIWEKGRPIWGKDPALWRSDDFGNLMYRWAYGKYWEPYGWEIDHVIPKSRGGTDDIANLRPVTCAANRSRQDHVSFDDLSALLRLFEPQPR